MTVSLACSRVDRRSINATKEDFGVVRAWQKVSWPRSYETNPIFVNHDLFRSQAELCVNRVKVSGSGSSFVVASIGRQVLPATDAETASSILWFATIQRIESK